VWRFLRPTLNRYDASIFSMPSFSQRLEHPQFVIPPSIDPFSPKNEELSTHEVREALERLGVPEDLPLLVQVSRFDRFKDPVGVIEAFFRVRANTPCRLVLAGGSADDDPEGAEVLEEVREVAEEDPDIHVLVLPPDAHRDINALQRAASVVLQKSTKEGFGLTVTEAMLKGRPVIGGAVGGITLQVRHGVTGYLVHSVAGAAHRVRHLLQRREEAGMMGARGRQLAIQQFLVTRHLRDLFLLFLALRADGRRLVRVRLGGS
jgi:trehalose synthase